MATLTLVQLKKLEEHKYSATGMSIIEPPFQIMWKWIVTKIPLWWAPNALTIIGLLINISTSLIVILFSPDAKQVAPKWSYVLIAAGLFVYQTLDAIDGKQARRTGSNSPLGELFDHGCDSVSAVFITISSAVAMQLGYNYMMMFIFCFSFSFLFYLAHWQAYVSGTLKFKWIDVTEVQFSVIVIYLLNVFPGPHIWRYEIYGTPCNMLLCYFSFVCSLVQGYTNLSLIFMEGGTGKNRSTIADTSTIFPLLPAAGVIITAFVIAQKSQSYLYETHPCLYFITFGIVFAKLTNSLVVGHMTKSEIALWDSIYIGPLALILNQYFNCVIPEHWVLWFCCIYCTYSLCMYAWCICSQICDYLNIYCFSITSKPGVTNGDTKSN